jgi:hypothetical protein
VHVSDVRQIEVCTAEPLIPDLSHLEAEIAIAIAIAIALSEHHTGKNKYYGTHRHQREYLIEQTVHPICKAA